MRILVVEDNPKIAEATRAALEAHGYVADTTARGYEAEELAAVTHYDCILLDIMLPDRDGLDVCRCLRRRGVKTPVIVLSALSSTEEKVAGLDAGADDYLVKPFEFEELIARVRAAVRRGEGGEETTLRCDDLELDLLTREARRGGQVVRLSTKEFALLEYLLRNQNRVLTRAQIGEKVWDVAFDHASNVIDVHISALRKKIDRGFEPELIHTVKGAGYRFGVLEPAAD